jgi:large subunit ribosomal protein L13
MANGAIMKSFMAKKEQVERNWVLVDAQDAVLGRMASKIAPILMGKTRPTYTPHVDTGDFVIVINADKIRVTGKKADTKQYDHYTHFPHEHQAQKPERIELFKV